MAKIFRIHKGASNTISDWGDSVKIGTKAIDSIPDPVGATSKKEITSIPSPFARMDLVKRAFKYVADHGLAGGTAYHKLVSDSLDVGQIFFNIEKYRNIISIIVWDKNNHLNQLEQSSFDGHKRLGKTYRTYIQQDGDEYNFNQMDCIYLLNYIDPTGPDMMNIIGATSPATLFFTSANDLSYVKKKIKFGSDSPFDDDYKPLYKREFDYIKYWYSLRAGMSNFAKVFPEVDLYLDKCFKQLSDSQRNDIRQTVLDASHYTSNYDDIPVLATSQQYVMILGEKLRRKPSVTNVDSEFEMLVSADLRKPGVNIPLALPVETYTEQTRYVIGKWDKNTHVPYFDDTPIAKRVLPDDGSMYPYITISDFLEDTIVKIPYRFNVKGYFDGNDSNLDAKDSYLLPLKKAYFDYFSVDSLRGTVGGRKAIEIQRLVGDTGVKVILRIPIKKHDSYIQYDRIYYKGANADAKANKGSIIEGKEFTVAQFPALKYPSGVKALYRVAILDRDSVAGDNNPYSLIFYNRQNSEVKAEGIVKRNCNPDGVRIDPYKVDSITYALENEYDYMRIYGNGVSAVVVPNFAVRAGNHKFRFAIDFGTTNTHIEYSLNGEASKAFDITEADMQIQKLHLTEDTDLRGVFNSDFLPETIGGESVYRYPMRSVISESQNTNWSKAVFSMANINIPFTYEKVMPLSYNILHTDLKWSAKQEDKQRAHKYIESLLIMLRNKVLLNNGDLSKTEIVWFYPASMTQGRFNKFKSEWDESFRNLFNAPQNNIIAMSESVAPYYYHKTNNGAVSTVVSVDIGGGTTDVLIVDKGKPEFLTSFRFAANTIFGDGYSYNAETNGIVRTYVPIIRKQLEANKFNSLKEVLNSLDNKKVSTDIIAFFFSLASNKEVLKEKVEIDFGKMLADDKRGKYVVIFFFVAIMYHIATIMKTKGFGMPRHITFSGNGSKVLNVLSANPNTLERLSKLIFEKVYEMPYSEDGLDIIRPTDSKESTCKGGILAHPFQSQDYSQIKTMKTVLLGTDDTTFVQPGMDYDSLTDSIKEQVIANCKSFINFAFDLDKEFSYYDEFEIDKSVIEDARKLCMRDIKTFLENGIELKKESIRQDGADNVVEETLFFYPLIGVMNALVREIYNL
jgi:hypothetical protein